MKFDTKRIILFFLLATTLTAAMASPRFSNRGTVDKPLIETANQSALGIERVVLDDSKTVLHCVIHYRPGYWVRLAATSTIEALGKSYPLIAADGIAIDQQVPTPETGVIRCTLTFPAIPAAARSIDFSEGTDNGWCVWGIDLTGKAGHDIHLDRVPQHLRNDSRNRPLPSPVIAWGDSATVDIRILGYRPAMGDKLRWGANTLYGQTGTDTPVSISPEGRAIVRLSLSAPADFFTISNIGSGSAIVSPGETVTLYIDSHLAGIRNMEARDEINNGLPDGFRYYFADGRYPDIRHNSGKGHFGMELFSGEFGDYHMDGNDYTAYITGLYKTLADSIDTAAGFSPMGRDYAHALLKVDLAYAAVYARNLLRHNYRKVYGWDVPVPYDSIQMALSPENVRQIAALIDFNDANLLLSGNVAELADISLWEEAGVDAGILKAVSLYRRAYTQADNARLDSAAIAGLRALRPAMADEVEAHYAATRARMEAIDSSHLCATPDVAPDQVLDAILSPHKGKVVMVDLWNTWCGPCRAAIAKHEPAKSGDLSSDDIVWIYIANESSPKMKYMLMIQDIKGLHYRLTTEQWEAICSRFKVDGIPYYILVGRDGTATGRPDLRDSTAYRDAILNALAR